MCFRIELKSRNGPGSVLWWRNDRLDTSTLCIHLAMCSIQNSQLLNFDLPLSFFIRPWNPIIASPSTSLASALVNSNASQDKLNYTNLSIYRLFWTPLTYLNKKRLSLSQTIIITIIYLNHLPIYFIVFNMHPFSDPTVHTHASSSSDSTLTSKPK
mgnify:CR=1 FL=1